jgi:hypothetical protein
MAQGMNGPLLNFQTITDEENETVKVVCNGLNLLSVESEAGAAGGLSCLFGKQKVLCTVGTDGSAVSGRSWPHGREWKAS